MKVPWKQGKDHGCYARLSYDEPHPTVHSYHKPHWHPSLVPFAPRVMSVREKARIQGFEDAFVFKAGPPTLRTTRDRST